jgi:hypothetical protein
MSSEVFATAALVVSLATFVVNYRWNQRAERRARMPVLVFRNRHETDVTVANIGNAPAMNILFAHGRPTRSDQETIVLKEGIHEEWFSPLHLRPIEPNGAVTVPCCSNYGLALKYSDVFEDEYVVKASDYGMRILEGKGHLPNWSMRDESRYLEELSPQTLDALCKGTADGVWAARSH